MDLTGLRPESVLAAAGRPTRTPGAPVNQPLALSATFVTGGEVGYGRGGNETLRAFELALGALEGGTSLVFGSGVAATAAVLDNLPAGSIVVLPDSCYNVHQAVLTDHEQLGRLGVRRVDYRDHSAVEQALSGAALLWMELPTNPMLQVPDLPALAEMAAASGALSAVDATVATPLGIRPLEHGADISMHSATKAIAGHSDVLLGVLSTRSDSLAGSLRRRRELTGALPGSLETFLGLRGLRTLAVRQERAQSNALVLARRLLEHPAVSAVHYPGLSEHPDAALVAKLLDGPGALLSFELTAGTEHADRVCERVRLICPATSLGSVETLIERRGRYPGELAQGTPPDLLRLSVGIEHVEDLWADLEQALV